MPPPKPQIIRVIDLETTGNAPPAHGVCEVGWQDVALQPDGRWELEGEGGQMFVNPGRPIPPITQAVHHILDEWVADAPWWQDAARRVLDPYPRRVALAAHRADFEQQFCTANLTHGADWICTWKCALRLWPDSPAFSNQVLRYWRKPHGIERAMACQIAIAGFKFERTRRQQHGTLALIQRLVEQARGEVVIEDRQRTVPVALGATETKHRM